MDGKYIIGRAIQYQTWLFAGDTFVFCEANEDQVMYMSWHLMRFEALSDLRVNLANSEMILVGGAEGADN